ncbi:MAG: hypothetical protein R3C11_08320 [Planctomycetaceae bacterium]
MAVATKKKLITGACLAILTFGGGGIYYVSSQASPSQAENSTTRDSARRNPVSETVEVIEEDLPIHVITGDNSGAGFGENTINIISGHEIDSGPAETQSGFQFAQVLLGNLFAMQDEADLNTLDSQSIVVDNLRRIKNEFLSEQVLDLDYWGGYLFKSDVANNHPDGMRLQIVIAAGDEVHVPGEQGLHVEREKYISLPADIKRRSVENQRIENP